MARGEDGDDDVEDANEDDIDFEDDVADDDDVDDDAFLNLSWLLTSGVGF